MSGACEEIAFEEVKVAVQKAKLGKASGPSGIVDEMLKAAGNVGKQCMTDLCNAVISEGNIPENRRKNCAKHRLSQLSHFMKDFGQAEYLCQHCP